MMPLYKTTGGPNQFNADYESGVEPTVKDMLSVE
jgi:hypothetical protein